MPKDPKRISRSLLLQLVLIPLSNKLKLTNFVWAQKMTSPTKSRSHLSQTNLAGGEVVFILRTRLDCECRLLANPLFFGVDGETLKNEEMAKLVKLPFNKRNK